MILPRVLDQEAVTCLHHELIILLFILLHPTFILVEANLYWLTIGYTMMVMVWVIFSEITYHTSWMDSGLKVKDRYTREIRHFNTYSMCHSLPHGLMVLNGLQLTNIFVGYLKKLGINFLAFLGGMHNIGSNSVILAELTCVHSVQITGTRFEKYKPLVTPQHIVDTISMNIL